MWMLCLVQWFSSGSWPDVFNPDPTPSHLQVLCNLGLHPPWASFRGDLGIGKMLVINPSWVMGIGGNLYQCRT